MACIARVAALDIPYHITQGGTGGTAGDMRIVSPGFRYRGWRHTVRLCRVEPAGVTLLVD